MSDRLAKLEGAFEGMRHGQNILAGVVVGGFALMIAVLLYLLTRIDALPDDFQKMNQTLSAAITAAKQTPPQVIVVPAPAKQP